MSPAPAWAQRSDFWDSIQTQHRLRSSRLTDMESETGTSIDKPNSAGRRVALEVYETHGEGILTQLDVFAIEQSMSSDGGKVIESKQIGICTGQLFNREHALNNSFNITTENAGVQIKTFVQCAYSEAGKLLPKITEPAPNPFDERNNTRSNTGTSNRDLIGEHSFVLIERISVNTAYRRKGIGTAMLDALLRDAQQMLPSVRFAVSWPCASDCDLADMGYPAGSRLPASGLGQKRAEEFHRAVGFHALGLTRFWAKSLSSSSRDADSPMITRDEGGAGATAEGFYG